METQTQEKINGQVPKIAQALASINRKVGAIGKTRKNQEQGYSFRGIDDAYNELHTLFADEGVVIVPRFIESHREERPRRNGGVLIYSISTYEFDFLADDGTKVTARLQGEGMDSGDKSLNKSFSAGLKYALLSMFLIPTQEQKDSEYENPEPMAQAPKPKPQAKVEQPTVISKPPLPEARFSKLLDQIHADRDKGMSLIETARTHFNLNDGQQSILADWEAVL